MLAWTAAVAVLYPYNAKFGYLSKVEPGTRRTTCPRCGCRRGRDGHHLAPRDASRSLYAEHRAGSAPPRRSEANPVYRRVTSGCVRALLKEMRARSRGAGAQGGRRASPQNWQHAAHTSVPRVRIRRALLSGAAVSRSRRRAARRRRRCGRRPARGCRDAGRARRRRRRRSGGLRIRRLLARISTRTRARSTTAAGSARTDAVQHRPLRRQLGGVEGEGAGRGRCASPTTSTARNSRRASARCAAFVRPARPIPPNEGVGARRRRDGLEHGHDGRPHRLPLLVPVALLRDGRGGLVGRQLRPDAAAAARRISGGARR